MKILPFIRPNIESEAFLKTALTAIGYSPMKGVDASRRVMSDEAKFLAALAAFHDKADVANPLKAIQDCGSLMRHLSYSFMVACDESLLLECRERTDIIITSAVAGRGRLIVATGNLQQWKQATLECCAEDAPPDLRDLFCTVLDYFTKIGLGDLWHDVRRKPLPDNTFRLEFKP